MKYSDQILSVTASLLICANVVRAAQRESRAPVTECRPVPENTQFTDPAPAPQSTSVLWYRQPAAKWVEALPIGNGSFGGMVFGGVTRDVLQFNHDTIWSKPPMPKGLNYGDRLPDVQDTIAIARQLIFDGKPDEADQLIKEQVLQKGYQWGTYQPFATLEAEYDFDVSEGVSGYRNLLDMSTGVVQTRFAVGATEYVREVFVANDLSVIAIHMEARGSGKISGSFTLSRTGQEIPRSIAADKIVVAGQAEAMNIKGVKFEAVVQAISPDGTVVSQNGVLKIRDAAELTILISGATNFNKKNPYTPLAVNLTDECDALLQTFVERGCDAVYEEAVAAHRELFDRVNLQLGSNAEANIPTDERIKSVRSGNPDPFLAAQVYQFGRYLLICSSRPGAMPANLQGLWNDRMKPPWYSDYHFDINVQMNYWMAENANLSECHMPYFDLLEGLVSGGKRVASEMLGCRGFMVSHATGGYFTTIPNGGPPYALWTMGGAWGVQHVMEHYRFTGNKKFLEERGLPLLREASLFCLDWLVEDPKTGRLVGGPDVSPENFYLLDNGEKAAIDMGCAMDQQVIWQAFSDYLEAVKIFGESDSVVEEVRAALDKLAPTARIGSNGRIMEWSQEFKDRVPGHRHISHLYAFCPGNQYHVRNAPELVEAAKRTVDYRVSNPGGAGKTGWSAAWVNCLYARFGEGEKAYESLSSFMKNNLFPNMLSIYPPDLFQIDGNFGYSLALTEMFLQSHAGEIEILPAVPEAWGEGRIDGLVARGGFEISMEWNNGKLTGGTITSRLGNPCTLRYGDKVVQLKLDCSETKKLMEVIL
jgi:alpha-L-fucosidase 2